MKQRNPFLVFLFPYITFGIYSWYWFVSTKNEMNKMGQKIPTAWLWLIPVVGSLWWMWKYSEGVGNVTNEKLSGVITLILLLFLGPIAHAIIQDHFNKISAAPAAATPVVAQPAGTPAPAPVVNPAPAAPQPASQPPTQPAS